jgi:putative transposase
LYCQRTRRCDHAQAALCRDLIKRLYDEGIATVYIGGLTDVLDTYWSVEANAKTYNFRAFKQFTDRLATTAEEYGISVAVRSEALTSQECSQCGSTDRTHRHEDLLLCQCGFEGHADRTASVTFLARQTAQAARPMARPVRLEWDDHEWSESSYSHCLKQQRTDPSTVNSDGNIAVGESA